jgi:hypothetical protein
MRINYLLSCLTGNARTILISTPTLMFLINAKTNKGRPSGSSVLYMEATSHTAPTLNGLNVLTPSRISKKEKKKPPKSNTRLCDNCVLE